MIFFNACLDFHDYCYLRHLPPNSGTLIYIVVAHKYSHLISSLIRVCCLFLFSFFSFRAMYNCYCSVKFHYFSVYLINVQHSTGLLIA